MKFCNVNIPDKKLCKYVYPIILYCYTKAHSLKWHAANVETFDWIVPIVYDKFINCVPTMCALVIRKKIKHFLLLCSKRKSSLFQRIIIKTNETISCSLQTIDIFLFFPLNSGKCRRSDQNRP